MFQHLCTVTSSHNKYETNTQIVQLHWIIWTIWNVRLSVNTQLFCNFDLLRHFCVVPGLRYVINYLILLWNETALALVWEWSCKSKAHSSLMWPTFHWLCCCSLWLPTYHSYGVKRTSRTVAGSCKLLILCCFCCLQL